MKPRPFDAHHVDVRAFAKASAALEGGWPLMGFERLRESLVLADCGQDVVTWAARGLEVLASGGDRQVWLHLKATASLPLQCQRCLQPCRHEVALDRHFQFVADEALAAELDAEVDHDVLVFSRDLDLQDLLEDELLLDLPVMPRHDRCPQPLIGAAEVPAVPDAPAHPFAALAELKLGKR